MSIIVPHHQLTVVVGVIERDNKILLIRRHDPEHAQWHHRWEFPGGKIELNETPVDALKREVNEETGLTIKSERLLGVYTQHWNTPKGIQQTFILLYCCEASIEEIQLNEQENDAYMWEKAEAIVLRSDLLDGNVKMFQQLYLK
ncbi:MAG: NUDIX domain-containing protein [Parachlamydiaceae bacterium]|nr:NUDIX domain-containing protein [Parachlamydiaceae bacterium]